MLFNTIWNTSIFIMLHNAIYIEGRNEIKNKIGIRFECV
jgi:hypothetical protein